jgi:amino acid transporter
MVEICSAYPTSCGFYYWSAKLAGKNWAPLASWLTGWYDMGTTPSSALYIEALTEDSI